MVSVLCLSVNIVEYDSWMIAGSLFNTHADVDISIERPLTSGVARGERGGACPGSHHFGVTPFFNAKA